MTFFEQLVQMEQAAKNIRGYADARSNLNTLVRDRKTGEMYDPQAKFDELMGTAETQAMLKRLAVR